MAIQLPYIGALLVYKATAGQLINGLNEQPAVVTKVVNDYTYDILVMPDGGGALIAYNNIVFAPNPDHITAKTAVIHWPIPRWA